MRINSALFCACLLGVLLIPGLSRASDVNPFYTRDLSPLVQAYGLPPSEDASTAPAGRAIVRLAFNLVNNSAIDWTPREYVVLDGETQRYDLAIRYGMTSWLEAGLDLSYVRHSGGTTDGFIRSFHETFGAGNGSARDAFGENVLRYSYERDRKVLLMLDGPASGPGDVRLLLGLGLYRGEGPGQRDLSLRAAVKIPAGESGRLLGSGTTDLSVQLSGRDGLTLSALDLTLWGSAGALFMGEGGALGEFRRDLVVFGSVGAGWSPLVWLTPKVQMDWHSPFYEESDLEPLSGSSAQIVLGLTARLAGEFFLDFAVSEDLAPKTAPDVAFHLALRRLI